MNGGHGMMFRDRDGALRFLLHFPNDRYRERPGFLRAVPDENGLRLPER